MRDRKHPIDDQGIPHGEDTLVVPEGSPDIHKLAGVKKKLGGIRADLVTLFEAKGIEGGEELKARIDALMAELKPE